MKMENIIDLHTCIQGEGKYMGVPHILIRFTGCNLNCQFKNSICDTSYASWKPEKGRYILKDLEDILIKNFHIKHVLITGGEPTIHDSLLVKVVDILRDYDKFITLETNGTIYLSDLVNKVDFVSISPKLRSSIPVIGALLKGLGRRVTSEDVSKQVVNRINYDSIGLWMGNFQYQLKFVISSDWDISEAIRDCEVLGCSRGNIYFMPEGVTSEQLKRHRSWLMNKCVQHGVNYTDRLHILAYNNKRGV